MYVLVRTVQLPVNRHSTQRKDVREGLISNLASYKTFKFGFNADMHSQQITLLSIELCGKQQHSHENFYSKFSDLMVNTHPLTTDPTWPRCSA